MNKAIVQLGGARLSNFELLRLLCMLMVLNLHSFFGYKHGDGILQALDFFRESTSICAVDTFILISGYFGIKWRKKGLFILLFQVLFYSFSVYGFCVVSGIIQFDKGEFVRCFKAFYEGWGFITNYIILYFVSPCLNAFAEKQDKKQMLFFIIVFFVAENFIMRDAGALNFCLVYLIGRLIAKTGTERISQYAGLGYTIATFAIFICSYLSYRILHLGAEEMGDFFLGYSYASPFIIVQAIFLFLLFSRLKIQSNLINWMAASCLSIFLIHMHPAIKQIGYYGFTESLYDRPVLEHTITLLALMAIVFFGAIIIDKVRIVISNSTYWLLAKVFTKITSFSLFIDNFLLRILGTSK